MPTYEYACKSCGKGLEIVQSFSDDPLVECPSCGGELKKVFGSIGIAFKGSGFYKTDSRSSSGSSAKAADSKGNATPSETAKSDTAKSETDKSGTKSSDSAPAPSSGGEAKTSK